MTDDEGTRGTSGDARQSRGDPSSVRVSAAVVLHIEDRDWQAA